MKTTLAHLLLPPKWDGEPSWIEREYPGRTFDFDTAERAASGEKHRALFVAIGEAKKENRCGWFRCSCRDDIELAVMVRLAAAVPGAHAAHVAGA
jgi:hypothetical protein